MASLVSGLNEEELMELALNADLMARIESQMNAEDEEYEQEQVRISLIYKRRTCPFVNYGNKRNTAGQEQFYYCFRLSQLNTTQKH